MIKIIKTFDHHYNYGHNYNYNLLPWRVTLRHKQKQQFIGRLGTAVLFGAIFVVAGYWSLQQKTTAINNTLAQRQQTLAKIQTIEQHTATTNKQINTLVQQKHILKQIENEQASNLELFTALNNTISPFIYLEQLQRQSNVITLRGQTLSLNAFTDFMQKLARIKWLEPPTLHEIKNNDINNPQDNSFTIQMAMKPEITQLTAQQTSPTIHTKRNGVTQ
jgi:type IV pilus assembly protein PilN